VGHWCVRHTARVGCGRRPWSDGAARCRNSCHTSWPAPTAQRAKRLPRFSSVASPTSR